MTRVLDPLGARYAYWLGLPAEDTADTAAEDPATVRAMPIILRIERAEPPGRTPLLEAAAAAALAVCLDERARPGGEWAEPMHAWLDNRIRKVARRARVIAVPDAGFTEVDPGTITVLARWRPDEPPA